jgi:cysteine desulfurase
VKTEKRRPHPGQKQNQPRRTAQHGGQPGIYLDFSATTPLLPAVVQAMRDCDATIFGNASSIHAFGRDARVRLEEARSEIAKSIHATSGEVIFTSGGTESVNFAIQGLLAKADPTRRTIVTSKAEHVAVLETCAALEKLGYKTVYASLDEYGQCSSEALAGALTGDTALVALMHANNEIGTVNNIAALATIAHEHGALFFTDAVQSFGKIPVDVKDLGVDALAFCAHKSYGPKGIGALFVKGGVAIEPIIHGGSQERNRRGGTESLTLAVGFQIAAREAMASMRNNLIHAAKLKNMFMDAIEELVPGAMFTMHPDDAIPHIVSITFEQAASLIPESLVPGLDLKGIAVSNGAACSSGSLTPSHVLTALGKTDAQAACGVRFSIGNATTEAELRAAAQALSEIVATRVA